MSTLPLVNTLKYNFLLCWESVYPPFYFSDIFSSHLPSSYIAKLVGLWNTWAYTLSFTSVGIRQCITIAHVKLNYNSFLFAFSRNVNVNNRQCFIYLLNKYLGNKYIDVQWSDLKNSHNYMKKMLWHICRNCKGHRTHL